MTHLDYTLENISEKDIVEMTITFLFKQGEKSRKQINDEILCAYEGISQKNPNKKLRCAIGAWIPQTFPTLLNFQGVFTSLWKLWNSEIKHADPRLFKFLYNNESILKYLQNFHDSDANWNSPQDFIESFKTFQNDYDIPSIKEAHINFNKLMPLWSTGNEA